MEWRLYVSDNVKSCWKGIHINKLNVKVAIDFGIYWVKKGIVWNEKVPRKQLSNNIKSFKWIFC